MRNMEKNEIPWYYMGRVVTAESVPEWAIGYVYVINHIIQDSEGSRQVVYVGKKQLNSTVKKKIGKRAIAAERASRADGKAKTVKRVTKPMDWQNYWGSSKSLHEAREAGIGIWERHIVQWCFSKKNMSYEEARWQFMMDVMNKPSYNDHIGNWYARDVHISQWLISKAKINN